MLRFRYLIDERISRPSNMRPINPFVALPFHSVLLWTVISCTQQPGPLQRAVTAASGLVVVSNSAEITPYDNHSQMMCRGGCCVFGAIQNSCTGLGSNRRCSIKHDWITLSGRWSCGGVQGRVRTNEARRLFDALREAAALYSRSMNPRDPWNDFSVSGCGYNSSYEFDGAERLWGAIAARICRKAVGSPLWLTGQPTRRL